MSELCSGGCGTQLDPNAREVATGELHTDLTCHTLVLVALFTERVAHIKTALMLEECCDILESGADLILNEGICDPEDGEDEEVRGRLQAFREYVQTIRGRLNG